MCGIHQFEAATLPQPQINVMSYTPGETHTTSKNEAHRTTHMSSVSYCMRDMYWSQWVSLYLKLWRYSHCDEAPATDARPSLGTDSHRRSYRHSEDPLCRSAAIFGLLARCGSSTQAGREGGVWKGGALGPSLRGRPAQGHPGPSPSNAGETEALAGSGFTASRSF